MLKATENSNFHQSLSHKHKHKHQAKINLMHGHSQAQRPVIDVGKCPRIGILEYPAKDAVCQNCGINGHHGKVCRNSAKSLNAVTTDEDDDVKRLAVSTRPLFGPGGNVFSVLGVARETLRRGKKTAIEDIYVVRHRHGIV